MPKIQQRTAAYGSTPSEKATKGAGGSTKGTQSRQQFANEFAYAEEPVQATCQMEETPLPVYETGADDQWLKKDQEKDKIRSKRDKNGKRGEARKSQE
nr:hypothetical protein [Tanacetum cinerariifolium]